MENTITLILLGTYLLMIALDFAIPARRFHRPRFWRAKGVAFMVAYVTVASSLPLLWDDLLGQYRLFDLTGLGMVGGAAAGILAVSFIGYWWHRALHQSSFLWRWFHQMHHSAERMDVFGAFYFSPLDMAGWTLVGSLGLVLVVGVTAEAAILANAILTFVPFFNHSNVRTPRWLGYIIQRPENHSIHHQRGVHAGNYSDISIWDMAFGTFRNPTHWEGEAGFYDGASSRIGDMLLGRDVSEPARPSRLTPPAPRPSQPVETRAAA